jgi:hypothetical protein
MCISDVLPTEQVGSDVERSGGFNAKIRKTRQFLKEFVEHARPN